MIHRTRVRTSSEPQVWFWLMVAETVEELHRAHAGHYDGLPEGLDARGYFIDWFDAKPDVDGSMFGGWVYLTAEECDFNFAAHEAAHAAFAAVRLRRLLAGQPATVAVRPGGRGTAVEEEVAYLVGDVAEAVYCGLADLGYVIKPVGFELTDTRGE